MAERRNRLTAEETRQQQRAALAVPIGKALPLRDVVTSIAEAESLIASGYGEPVHQIVTVQVPVSPRSDITADRALGIATRVISDAATAIGATPAFTAWNSLRGVPQPSDGSHTVVGSYPPIARVIPLEPSEVAQINTAAEAYKMNHSIIPAQLSSAHCLKIETPDGRTELLLAAEPIVIQRHW